MKLAKTFEEWYHQILAESCTSEIDPKAFANASNPTKVGDKATRIKALTEEIDALVILSNSMKGLTIAHSISNLGGTRSRPTNKVVGLQGLGREASSMMIDHESAVTAFKVNTPNPEKIMECKTVEELEALQTSGNTSTRSALDCMPVYFLSPDETDIVMKAKTTNCFELILAFCDAAQEKDNDEVFEIVDGDQETNKGFTLSKPLLQYLWAVGKGSIPEAKIALDSDDAELNSFKQRRHAQCILPPAPTEDMPPAPSASTFDQLNSTLSRIGESTDQANALRALEIQRSREKDDSKKDRSKKWLHSQTIRMLKNASSADGSEPSPDISPEFKNAFNLESAGAFGKELVYLMDQKGMKNTIINEGAVNSMYHGVLTSTTPNTPQNHSPFSYREAEPLAPSQAQSFLILHMGDTHGKAKSNEEIKASMAQTFTTPMDYYDMLDRTKRYNKGNEIIFTESSLLVKRVNFLIDSLADNSITIRACGMNDKEFFTKILYSIDTRVNLWLKDCQDCECREDVDDSLIDFRPMMREIILQTFRLELPACFKMVAPKKRLSDPEAVENAVDRENNSNNSKKKQKNREKVINQNQFEEFKLLPNEDYKKVFTGREKAAKRPLFKTKAICQKFNIHGFCFNDCANGESHVSHNEYTAKQKEEFSKWMKYCREIEG